MRKSLAALTIFALAVLCLAGCGEEQATNDTSGSKLTRQKVEEFTESAVEYAKKNGKEKALAVFSDPKGAYKKGELYVYAYDFDGKVIAHGGDQTLIGKNLMEYRDPNGFPVIQALRKKAKEGGGWVEYTWQNPETKKQQRKLGYVLEVDDGWFLGSGMYE